MTPNRRSTPVISKTDTIPQIHSIMSSVAGAVKNAKEAKSHLRTKNWIAPGEKVSIEVLARILFAAVTSEKIPQAASTTICSVAYLLTENLEDGILFDMADKISMHIKDTLDSLTSDLHVKLDQHVQAVNETAQSQAALTDKLLLAQKNLDDTTQKALTNTKTYSQIVATGAPTGPAPLPPPVSFSQVRLRNREEIKKRQVLIEFDNTRERHLDSMNDVTLARKAKDAITTAWAISPLPKPQEPGVRAAVLLRGGGLLLELTNSETADWLHKETNRRAFLDNLGSGASIKDRTYQVIVQFIPIAFNPDDNASIRQYEETNGLEKGSVLKVEWIKPVEDRKQMQRVAMARFYHRDAKSANHILSKGAYILNKKTIPKKPRKEPIRCLKCQQFGHERRHCTAATARCAKCACAHETEECTAPRRGWECVNCGCRHPSYDRYCQSFLDKCAQLNTRCPENSLAFYPTDEPWSWATMDRIAESELCDDFQEQGQGHMRLDEPRFRPSAANNIPIGQGHLPGQQQQPPRQLPQ